MHTLRFFFRHALVNLRGNPQRTLFVVFNVAVGVAAIVALRSIGLMIGDGLVADLQADNRADVVIAAPMLGPYGDGKVDPALVDERGEHDESRFSRLGIERITSWARERGATTSLAVREEKPHAIFAADRPEPVTAFTIYVEPEAYPFYGATPILEPAGATLAGALRERDAVVLTRRLADQLQVGVGDRLEMGGSAAVTVTAIVADEAEARLREMKAVLLPYALRSYAAAEEQGLTADTIYARLPAGGDVAAISSDFATAFPGVRHTSTDDLRKENEELSTVLTQLVTTLGLVSLLIGGIGIVNTMLVVVGRRTVEIGVLKTLGLQGSRISAMFLVEALLVGVAGSVLGVGLGVGLMVVLQRVAEKAIVQELTFTVYPEALGMGLVTGVLVTLVFGFLPTLSAAKVRPNVVLQPDRSQLPKTGRALTALVVLGLTAPMGLLVARILGKPGLGFAIAYGTVAVVAIATFALWLLVKLVGRLPTPRNPTLKLAQRAACAYPGRTASTVLALMVGMASLSSVMLVTRTLLNVIEDVLEEKVGGDLILVPREVSASNAAAARLAELDGVARVQHDVVFASVLAAVDGERDLEPWIAGATAKAVAEKKPDDVDDDGEVESIEKRTEAIRRRLTAFTRELDVARKSDVNRPYVVDAGVDVAGPGELVLRRGRSSDRLGLAVGDTLTITIAGEERTAKIVGSIAPPPPESVDMDIGVDATLIVADGEIPAPAVPKSTPFIVETRDGARPEVMRALSRIDGLFVLEAALINHLLAGVFEKLSTLPLVVAILALFAAGMIIANAVSLAVLERRREIGVMKALGLGSAQVLRLLLLENGLIGVLGGVLGCGVGAAAILSLGVLSESPGSFPAGTLTALVALSVAIAAGATLVTGWGASRERPLVVLRHE